LSLLWELAEPRYAIEVAIVIPGPFSYHRPHTLPEALALLARHEGEGRLLAGGQSLIPLMKLRLAAPEHLIDLAAIGDLKRIERSGKGLLIGAMVTQAELIAAQIVADTAPLVPEASLLVADPQVRYVGTLGGNLANGDPGNDMPAIMLCLNASYRLVSEAATRTLAARDFYEGTYATALRPSEILTAVEIPAPPPGHGHAYEKLKRKIGDYATAAAAVVLTKKEGRIATCAIALSNLADKALLATDAAAAVVGTALEKEALAAAAKAARAIMAPATDTRGSAEFKSFVGGVMVQRALQRAFARARG
jgi:carbon-monoxide dehydrogenase medium subunit